MIEKYLEVLGYEVKDKVTGFSGVADSLCFDVYGCVMVSIVPKHRDEDKERRSPSWFDTKRVVKTGDKRVIEPFPFTEPGSEPGPASHATKW